MQRDNTSSLGILCLHMGCTCTELDCAEIISEIIHSASQVWYADDASVCGYLNDIHEWVLSFVPKVLLLVLTLSLLRVFYLLMTDIVLKLKDYLVLWVFGLLQVIIS